MSLEAHLVVRTHDAFDLDVSVDVADGEVLAILGPNGAGKTTVLRTLAGLVPLDGGHVHLDGVVLEDWSTGVAVPVQQRSIGVVFSDYLLFPHLSARDNVAYGLRRSGHSRASARRVAQSWLTRVGLTEHGSAHVRELSGGEQQRVALARALAIEPRLLLLDEPLAALDATTRIELRRELRRHLSQCTGVRVLVTHDPLDALALADRLVVIEQGRVVQTGTPIDISTHPRSRYVADLVGLNLFRGVAQHSTVTTEDGSQLTVVSEYRGEVFAVVHPRAVTLHRTHPDTSARNTWSGAIVGIEHRGDVVRVHVRRPGSGGSIVAEVTAAALAELQLRTDSDVWVAVKATEIDVYPR
jgi:molybdate transport system ATP-binding protein